MKNDNDNVVIHDMMNNVDLSKYNTFIMTLEYPSKYSLSNNKQFVVRPSTSKYEDFFKTNVMLELEASLLVMDGSISLSQACLECTLRGIPLDFIEFQDKDNRIFKTIDLHKEKLPDDIDSKILAPNFYVAISKKNANLKYLVVDRRKQDFDVDFLSGKYNMNAVVAAFTELRFAKEHCCKLNEMKE